VCKAEVERVMVEIIDGLFEGTPCNPPFSPKAVFVLGE